MAFVPIPNNPHWEYDNAPADPGPNSPQRALWQLSANGIRQFKNGTEVYTKVRKVGDGPDANRGELSKSFWDAQS
jgi:hypothetical protein